MTRHDIVIVAPAMAADSPQLRSGEASPVLALLAATDVPLKALA